MTSEAYKQYTLSLIRNGLNGIESYDKIPPKLLWRLYEWSGCVTNDVIPWEIIPIPLKEAKNCPIKDYGIDGANLTFTKATQVKYRTNSSLTFQEVSTFYTLAIGRLKMRQDQLNLIMSEGCRPAKMVRELGIPSYTLSEKNFHATLDYAELLPELK